MHITQNGAGIGGTGTSTGGSVGCTNSAVTLPPSSFAEGSGSFTGTASNGQFSFQVPGSNVVYSGTYTSTTMTGTCNGNITDQAAGLVSQDCTFTLTRQ
jgi:hypothetical protein